MQVINVQQSSSIIPEAVVNIYQAVNAVTRIIRKTAENIERTTDLGFEVMNMTLEAQRVQLDQRRTMLTVN